MDDYLFFYLLFYRRSNKQEGFIAILAGVVNFLPHPNPPRTRPLGSKKFTNDLGLL